MNEQKSTGRDKLKALTRESALQILADELSYLQRQYGVQRMALYGSFVHSTPSPKSDVDLLVELSRPLGFEFVALADYLEERLGRKVHLATFSHIRRIRDNPRYRDIVLEVEKTLVDVPSCIDINTLENEGS